MKRKMRLLWTFYKNFFLVSMIINLGCLRIFWGFGYASFTTLFWFKIITAALIFYLVNILKRNEYYYYQNLGMHKKLLWSITMAFDLIFFILLITQIYKFK